MNNEKIALIDSFASRRSNLIYDKKLRKYCKTINATILFSQLIYWFSKQQYRMFYKFTSPCSNGRYKEGDSWIEELGFTGREFDEAFNLIGFKISSKDQLFESKDEISNHCFYSYHDRKSKQTWYNINLDKVTEVMVNCYQNEIIANKLSQFSIPNELEEMIKNIESINSEVNGINSEVNGIHSEVNGIHSEVNTYSPTGKSIIIQNTTQNTTQDITQDNKTYTTPSSPTSTPAESSDGSLLGVGINTQGVTTIDLQSKDVGIENIDLETNCLNNLPPSPPLLSPAKRSTDKLSFDIQQAFDEVWKLYPDKDGKVVSFKKYEKIIKKTPSLVFVILDKVKDLRKFKELMTTEEFKAVNYFHYFKNFSTWLNQECWEEEFVENLLDKTSERNRRAYKLILDKFRPELTTQTTSQTISDIQPLSRTDYLNAMNDLYNH